MADTATTYEIQELVVHGSSQYHSVNHGDGLSGCSVFMQSYNHSNYLEFGYAASPGMNRVPPENMSNAQKAQRQLAALNDIAVNSGISDIHPSHQNGNPPLCIYIKIGSFERTLDSRVKVTITDAYMREHNVNGYPKPEPTGHRHVTTYGYYMDITAVLYVNGKLSTKVKLFTKSGYDRSKSASSVSQHHSAGYIRPGHSGVDPYNRSTFNHWEDGKFGMKTDSSGNPIPITVVSAKSIKPTDRVQFAVLSQSVCTCDAGDEGIQGLYRPVFADDVTDLFPPPPKYIWRKFGTSQSNDREGYNIDPNKLDGDWHLVSPVYVMDNNHSWKSVEDE